MKEKILSLVRTLITLAGAYILGKNLFGLPIDESTLQILIGIGMGVISVVWSLLDKTLANDMWQGVVRHIITFAAGILMAKGIVDGQTIQTVLAALASVFPWLQANLSNAKNAAIKSGELNTSTVFKN